MSDYIPLDAEKREVDSRLERDGSTSRAFDSTHSELDDPLQQEAMAAGLSILRRQEQDDLQGAVGGNAAAQSVGSQTTENEFDTRRPSQDTINESQNLIWPLSTHAPSKKQLSDSQNLYLHFDTMKISHGLIDSQSISSLMSTWASSQEIPIDSKNCSAPLDNSMSSKECLTMRSYKNITTDSRSCFESLKSRSAHQEIPIDSHDVFPALYSRNSRQRSSNDSQNAFSISPQEIPLDSQNLCHPLDTRGSSEEISSNFLDGFQPMDSRKSHKEIQFDCKDLLSTLYTRDQPHTSSTDSQNALRRSLQESLIQSPNLNSHSDTSRPPYDEASGSENHFLPIDKKKPSEGGCSLSQNQCSFINARGSSLERFRLSKNLLLPLHSTMSSEQKPIISQTTNNFKEPWKRTRAKLTDSKNPSIPYEANQFMGEKSKETFQKVSVTRSSILNQSRQMTLSERYKYPYQSGTRYLHHAEDVKTRREILGPGVEILLDPPPHQWSLRQPQPYRQPQPPQETRVHLPIPNIPENKRTTGDRRWDIHRPFPINPSRSTIHLPAENKREQMKTDHSNGLPGRQESLGFNAWCQSNKKTPSASKPIVYTEDSSQSTQNERGEDNHFRPHVRNSYPNVSGATAQGDHHDQPGERNTLREPRRARVDRGSSRVRRSLSHPTLCIIQPLPTRHLLRIVGPCATDGPIFRVGSTRPTTVDLETYAYLGLPPFPPSVTVSLPQQYCEFNRMLERGCLDHQVFSVGLYVPGENSSCLDVVEYWGERFFRRHCPEDCPVGTGWWVECSPPMTRLQAAASTLVHGRHELHQLIRTAEFSRVEALAAARPGLDPQQLRVAILTYDVLVLSSWNPPNLVTPLLTAIYTMDRELVRYLLLDGADPDEGLLFGLTPLGLAMAVKRTDIALALERGGARGDVPDAYRNTPLHYMLIRDYQLPTLIFYFWDLANVFQTVE